MSDDIAIHVLGLGKKYTIGGPQEKYLTFRDAITNSVRAPFRKLTQRGGDQSTNEFWALKDISFDAHKGEVIGIIGRNGAGKSTLLKILSRITTPTEGEVDIYGRVGSLLEVGTGFHWELTGRENIFLSGSILGMRKREIEQKFDDIIKFSEIEKFIDTPVKRYSSGMYVRLAFAVAAHMDTEILLVDEVLAVGDSVFQKKCMGKMGDVAKEGRTVLFVSHNMAAVENLCSRCILLDEGIAILNDHTSIVINKYLLDRKESIPTPLKDRKDRHGDGRLRFTETWVENSDGHRVTSIQTGSRMKIVVLYEVKMGEEISNLTVGFAINTIQNIAITDLSNSTTGDYFVEKVPENGRIECVIPKLPLNVGIYFYNVIARSGGAIEDWVQQAGKFDVDSGDFYSTGKIPDSARLILIDHTWSITKLGVE